MKKARTITTAEGRYLNLQDMKEALEDDRLMTECLHVLAFGRRSGRPAVDCMRQAVANALMEMAGDTARMEKKAAEWMRAAQQ